MSKIKFYIILIVILLLCNTTLFVKGFSYIGYAVVISILLYSFLGFLKNRHFYYIVFTGFILSLLNVASEIFMKFAYIKDLDTTEYNLMFFIGLLYLIITITREVLWQQKES